MKLVSARLSASALSLLFAAGLFVPLSAGATSLSHHNTHSYSRAASSVCAKVSAASVSAIVGHKVPAGTPYTINTKATPTNFGVSAVDTTCTYGAQTSMAALLKTVTLSYEVLSKPLTTSQMEQSISKATAGSKFKFSSYSGLGFPAFYFILNEAGITGQGILGVKSATHYYGASVETKNITKSQLASLVKLAEQL